MSTITTRDGTEIYYKDWGPKTAQPIVFHHGWPLSGDDWDTQMLYFLDKGYRVIAHDRRGHGRSAQVSDGHDMDHYAADVAAVVEHLDLGGLGRLPRRHRCPQTFAYRDRPTHLRHRSCLGVVVAVDHRCL